MNNCENCHNCKLLAKKIELYEQFFNDMKKIDEELLNNTSLEESIIIEKDKNGIRNMKVKSELSESLLIINNGKNLEELNKIEKASIKEQDNVHNYTKTKEYFDKASGVVSWGSTIIKWTKWILLI